MDKHSTLCVGLDLGDRWSHVTTFDPDGNLVEQARLATTPAAFQGKSSSLPACRVAMEVGAHSRWVSYLLRELGHEVLVANARKMRVIYENPRKGDRADAETLARLAPALLSPVHHRAPQAQADLGVLRSRDALVRARSSLIDHARGTVKTTGARLPSCTSYAFASKARRAIPESLQRGLSPILDAIATLTQRIRAYDRQIDGLSQERYPEAQQLQRVSGVGLLTGWPSS